MVSLWNRPYLTHLAMRSLRPEDFFTSEVVLHTCGPTQTVAKCVLYRWSIQCLFVLRGANNMYWVIVIYLYFYLIILSVITIIESFQILPIDGRYTKYYSWFWENYKIESWKKILRSRSAKFHSIFFFRTPVGQDIYPFNFSCYYTKVYTKPTLFLLRHH